MFGSGFGRTIWRGENKANSCSSLIKITHHTQIHSSTKRGVLLYVDNRQCLLDFVLKQGFYWSVLLWYNFGLLKLFFLFFKVLIFKVILVLVITQVVNHTGSGSTIYQSQLYLTHNHRWSMDCVYNLRFEPQVISWHFRSFKI